MIDSRARDVAASRQSGDRAGGPPFVVFKDVQSLRNSLERRGAGRCGGERRLSRSSNRLQSQSPVDFRDLCHDLRQPVAAVAALAAGLEQEADLSAAGRQRLEQLQEETARLSTLLQEFLRPPEPVLVDVAALVRQTVTSIGPLVRPPVELLLDAHAVVAGDPVLLGRVLANLVQNAGHAASDHGQVRVSVSRVSAEVVVLVEDTGDRVRSGAPSGGYGLGLTIVQAVVSAHRGRVDSRPSPLGGLQVRVHLPLALPAQGAA